MGAKTTDIYFFISTFCFLELEYGATVDGRNVFSVDLVTMIDKWTIFYFILFDFILFDTYDSCINRLTLCTRLSLNCGAHELYQALQQTIVIISLEMRTLNYISCCAHSVSQCKELISYVFLECCNCMLKQYNLTWQALI